jgi:hypothetical protein
LKAIGFSSVALLEREMFLAVAFDYPVDTSRKPCEPCAGQDCGGLAHVQSPNTLPE